MRTATEYLWFSTKKHREYLNEHYRHHRTGETNGDSHLKSLLVHHEVVVPITGGRLDLGPWQQVYYAEFDGRRRKRVVVKVMGEERRASG